MNHGKFIISLDFELLWGVRDKKTIDQYGSNIRGVHQIIPRLLQLFEYYQVAVTFSTVGFLFFENKAELLEHIPNNLPSYDNKNLSPYLGHFDILGNTASEDPYHYAPNMIQAIQQQPQHEIGTHTFSHYYCLEAGQTVEQFKEDLVQAIAVAKEKGINITSIIFPRNQYDDSYLKVCYDLGIYCFRGNENSWIYESRNGNDESLLRRALRLIDAYVNISGHHGHTDTFIKNNKLIANVASSRFLRPYSQKLSFLERFRLQRITSSMTYAAKHNLSYHLWWHPHNFGVNQEENLNFLAKILSHYASLNLRYGFQSYTMSNLVNLLKNEKI